MKKYFVSYKMRSDNRVVERIVYYRKKHPLLRDTYRYDERNHCIGFVRYNAIDNKELFQVDYKFFSKDDLPESE